MAEPNAAARAEPANVKTGPVWDQQQGENDLWYCRFLRYVALGPTRSISLLAKGRRNAYPVAAHWPMQAKQKDWLERARAFDRAVNKEAKLRRTIEDPIPLVEWLNERLASLVPNATNGEDEKLKAAIEAGGYQLPNDDDDPKN